MSTNRPNKKNNSKQAQVPLSDLIDDLTEAIQSNPKDAVAYFNRGKVYHSQGNYDQAIKDYKTAIQLEPKLKAEIEFYVQSKLKRSDDLKQIPTPVLVEKKSSFLAAGDLSHLSRTDKERTRLFKPALALKKLLRLVVRYELDEKKIEAGIKAGVNPILKEVDALLTQDPTLALKRDHITDQSGRKFYCSPLEAVHWSGNWVLRDMILKHAKSIPAKGKASGEERAAEQLRKWDEKAYNYDLILMRAEGDTFPLLKKIPTLIKKANEEGEEKIFQWGDVNGEWQLTELDGETEKLFVHLNFPDSSSKKPITTTSNQITTDMYDALKKGHTVAHFDLDEYVRVTDAFVKKYPVTFVVPFAQWEECDRDSYKIGMTQKKMPAWLAAVWCSTIPFHPLPDVRSLIAAPDVCRLVLYSDIDFFEAALGKDFSIYKASSRHGCVEWGWGDAARGDPAGRRRDDLAAMATLCEAINEELVKSKQLLPEESKSTPGLKPNS